MVRGLLRLATPFYGAAVQWRNSVFDRGWYRVHRAGVPVVSVGNLTTGGTGKTPLVAWLVQRLEQLGASPAILSRGYRAVDAHANDEKLVLDRLCPGVPHIQNPDRVAGAATALADGVCNLLVLDDGFQHRRLHRDLDLVLIDALNPWGYGQLLPRGLLREPISSLRRAGVVVITRADQADAAALQAIRDVITRHTPAPIAEAAFVPTRLVNAAGDTAPLSLLHQKRIGACCGIGNPQAFLRTLTALGAPPEIQNFRTYPDHHHYSACDQADLGDWSRLQGLELLVVTQKDLVKLPVTHLGRVPLWAVEIGAEFRSGGDAVETLLKALVRGASS